MIKIVNILKVTKKDVCRLAIYKQHLSKHNKKGLRLLDMISDLGCIQLDPIDTVAPSHLLVLWSRLGDNFNKKELEDLRWKKKLLFEYLAHAASIVLTKEYPIYKHTMNLYKNDRKKRTDIDEWLKNVPNRVELEKHIKERLHNEKALLSREIKDESSQNPIQSRWWSGRYIPNLLHAMWLSGEVTVVGRKGRQKLWGLTKDFIFEKRLIELWPKEKITKFSIVKSIKALGIATKKQIKNHYTRYGYPDFEKVFSEMIKGKILLEVQVLEFESISKNRWYIHKDDVKSDDFACKTVLLSPFDNLICDRERTELLFDFKYRIEIYTPKDKRKYGYYVMPILHHDQLIGRADLSYNKKVRKIDVINIFPENKKIFTTYVDVAIKKSIADLEMNISGWL